MVQNLLEALEEYRKLRSKEANNIRSHVRKHVLPELLLAWKLERLQQKCTDIVFEQLSIAGFVVTANPIFQRKLLQVNNANTRKVMKSQWKRFCEWLQVQEWYIPEPIPCTPVLEESMPFTHLPRGDCYQKRTRKKTNMRYGLKKSEINPVLWKQLQAFDQFCQTISKNRLDPNRDITQKSYRNYICLFFGWLKNVQQVEVNALDLDQFTDPILLKAYEKWNRDRGISSNTIDSYMRLTVLVAKFLFYQNSPSANQTQLEEALKTLREFIESVVDQKDRPYSSDEACQERAVTIQQCETIVSYLGWRCKNLERQEGLTSEVIDAWMDYLIIALLVTTGVRQREIRELCLDRLVLNSDSTYSVSLNPDDHKIGSKTHKGRGYPLFVGPLRTQLCTDLKYYLESIRPKNLDHSHLFFIRGNRTSEGTTTLRGDCIKDAVYLSSRVPGLMSRVTEHLFGSAKATTCHDFRRITATWVCTYGEPKHFSIYAEMLGHSEKMLRELYAKLHPGALAAQVPFAYEEIAANEARVSGKTLQASGPTIETHFEIALNLLLQLWGALPKSKRKDFLEICTPAQLQLLGIM